MNKSIAFVVVLATIISCVCCQGGSTLEDPREQLYKKNNCDLITYARERFPVNYAAIPALSDHAKLFMQNAREKKYREQKCSECCKKSNYKTGSLKYNEVGSGQDCKCTDNLFSSCLGGSCLTK